MDLQSVDLVYEEQGHGTPVILIHGFPFDRSIWRPILPLLSEHAHLVLPDLRGFGQSPVTDGIYPMRLLAEDIVHLMDRLKLEKAILVGHSMGGYISLAFALAYPNRLLGLGLVATQAAADSAERRQTRLKLVSLVKRRGVKAVAESMATRITPRTDLIEPLMGLMLRSNRAAVIGALRGMAERPDVTGELSSIGVPAVVLAGGADQLLSMENMETMAQMLPKGWMVEIPEGGHMLMMETPEKVANGLSQLIGMVKA